MNNQALVSVLIPVYNSEHYIKEAIQSILNQTYQKLEIIILDDGSTDTSPEIIKGFQDRRIQYYYQSNQGISSARNRLFSLAKGKYLAINDADDFAFPFRIKKQVEFLENNPEYLMVGSSAVLINHSGKYNGILFTKETDAAIKWQLLFNNAFVNSSTLCRREVVVNEAITYGEYDAVEDYRFWFKMSRFGKARNFLMPLIRYRIHERQTTARIAEDKEMYRSRATSNNLKNLGFNLSYEDAKILNDLYWGNDYSSINFPRYIALVNEIKMRSNDYYSTDFQKHFRDFYDKILIKSMRHFNLAAFIEQSKAIFRLDKIGIILFPLRFCVYPFRLLLRVLKKGFALFQLFGFIIQTRKRK